MSVSIEDLVNLQGIMNAIRRNTPFADIPAQMSPKAFPVGVFLVTIMADPRFQGMVCAPIMVPYQLRVVVGLPAVVVVVVVVVVVCISRCGNPSWRIGR